MAGILGCGVLRLTLYALGELALHEYARPVSLCLGIFLALSGLKQIFDHWRARAPVLQEKALENVVREAAALEHAVEMTEVRTDSKFSNNSNVVNPCIVGAVTGADSKDAFRAERFPSPLESDSKGLGNPSALSGSPSEDPSESELTQAWTRMFVHAFDKEGSFRVSVDPATLTEIQRYEAETRRREKGGALGSDEEFHSWS